MRPTQPSTARTLRRLTLCITGQAWKSPDAWPFRDGSRLARRFNLILGITDWARLPSSREAPGPAFLELPGLTEHIRSHEVRQEVGHAGLPCVGQVRSMGKRSPADQRALLFMIWWALSFAASIRL